MAPVAVRTGAIASSDYSTYGRFFNNANYTIVNPRLFERHVVSSGNFPWPVSFFIKSICVYRAPAIRSAHASHTPLVHRCHADLDSGQNVRFKLSCIHITDSVEGLDASCPQIMVGEVRPVHVHYFHTHPAVLLTGAPVNDNTSMHTPTSRMQPSTHMRKQYRFIIGRFKRACITLAWFWMITVNLDRVYQGIPRI